MYYKNILLKACIWISPTSIVFSNLADQQPIYFICHNHDINKEDFLVLIIFFIFIFCPLNKVHYIQFICSMLTLKFPAPTECNHLLWQQPISVSDVHGPCRWVHYNIGSVAKLQLIEENLSFIFFNKWFTDEQ